MKSVDYQVIKTSDELLKAVESLSTHVAIGLDTETLTALAARIQ